MTRVGVSKEVRGAAPLYGRVCEILDAARAHVARTVNTTQVMANWLIGREMVEEAILLISLMVMSRNFNLPRFHYFLFMKCFIPMCH